VTKRRSYEQHCGLARALDLVGERWTLLIVRDLLLGPRRYGDLLGSLDGITTNLLAKRLQEMAKLGLLEKRRLPPPASSDVYALTEAGRALEPAVMELARWGGRLLEHPRQSDKRDIGWALLSMKRRYAGGLDFVAEVSTEARSFELVFADRLGVEEKRSDRAVVRARASDQEVLFDVFFRGVASQNLERKGQLSIDGERRLWTAMVRAFAPPPGSNVAPRKAALP
jgi:DNA-binding HxlR family transcriptional regulator